MLVNDPNTDTIILFLETLRNSDEVADMSRMAHAAGKQNYLLQTWKNLN